MRTRSFGWAGGIAGVLLTGVVAAAGCAGADDPGTSETQAELRSGEWFHHPHRDDGAGGTTVAGTGGMNGSTTADGGAATDCSICTQAQRCCGVVESQGPGCSFSASTCASMTGAARPAYVNACLTYVVSVRGAWGGNPPAECR